GYVRYPELPANGTAAYWDGVPNLWAYPSSSNFRFHLWRSGSTFPYENFGRNDINGLQSYGESGGWQILAPWYCGPLDRDPVYVIAVDETTGIVSNAGRVGIPTCVRFRES